MATKAPCTTPIIPRVMTNGGMRKIVTPHDVARNHGTKADDRPHRKVDAFTTAKDHQVLSGSHDAQQGGQGQQFNNLAGGGESRRCGITQDQ